jgi:acyl dehydratase
MAGFPMPILHGLCTYGVAGRALVAELGGGHAGKVKSIAARFTAPVFPGDTLTTSVWRTEPGQALFRTEASSPDGSDARLVLEDGVAEYQAEHQECSSN